MPSEITAALIGIIGVLVGVWLGGRLSRQASQELLAQQAKAHFAASFSETLARLQTEREEGMGFAMRLLQTQYPVHLAAYYGLRATLSSAERKGLDDRWQQYSNDAQHSEREDKEELRFFEVLSEEGLEVGGFEYLAPTFRLGAPAFLLGVPGSGPHAPRVLPGTPASPLGRCAFLLRRWTNFVH